MAQLSEYYYDYYYERIHLKVLCVMFIIEIVFCKHGERGNLLFPGAKPFFLGLSPSSRGDEHLQSRTIKPFFLKGNGHTWLISAIFFVFERETIVLTSCKPHW